MTIGRARGAFPLAYDEQDDPERDEREVQSGVDYFGHRPQTHGGLPPRRGARGRDALRGKCVYVYYVYNNASTVTNKESRLALLEYIVNIKFKQIVLSEVQ